MFVRIVDFKTENQNIFGQSKTWQGAFGRISLKKAVIRL